MNDGPAKTEAEARQYRLAAMKELHEITRDARHETFPFDWERIERELFEKLSKR